MKDEKILSLAPVAARAAAAFCRGRCRTADPAEVYADANLLLVGSCRKYRRRRHGPLERYVYLCVLRGLKDQEVKARRRDRLLRRLPLGAAACVPAREPKPELELNRAGRRAVALALLLGDRRRPAWSRMVVRRELAAWRRRIDADEIFEEVRRELE